MDLSAIVKESETSEGKRPREPSYNSGEPELNQDHNDQKDQDAQQDEPSKPTIDNEDAAGRDAPPDHRDGATVKLSGAEKRLHARPILNNKDLNKTTEKAPEEFLCVLNYTTILEDRLQKMEATIEALKNGRDAPRATPSNPASSATGSGIPSIGPEDGFNLKTEIKRVSGVEFHKCVSHFVIDVLYGDTEESPNAQQLGTELQAQTSTASEQIKSPSELMGNDQKDLKGERPSRVKINSRRLQIGLSSVTGQRIRMNSREILSPFKIFAEYEQEIRQYYKFLEESTRSSDKTEDDVVPNQRTEQESEGGEEIDDSMYPIGDVFEIIELCQVSRKKAGKAMVDADGNVDAAISAIRSKMPEFDQQLATAAWYRLLLPEWRALIRFLDEDLKVTLDVCAKIRSGELKRIAFEDLYHLFKPGDIAFHPQERKLEAQMEALQVYAVSGGRKFLNQYSFDNDPDKTAEETLGKALESLIHTQTKYSPFIIDCVYYDFDGEDFGAVSNYYSISKYAGTELITSLPLYPAKFRSDGVDWRSGLTTRGKKYASLCKKNQVFHKQYLGRTLDNSPEEVDSRVIIDLRIAATINGSERPEGAGWIEDLGLGNPAEQPPGETKEILPQDEGKAWCSRPTCTLCDRKAPASPIFQDQLLNKQRTKEFIEVSPLLTKEKISIEELGSDQFLLLPDRLPGFILRSRKWARLDIDNITDVNMDKENFKKLVLPEGHADIVQALVETHFQQSESKKERPRVQREVDLVRGKGKGLIVLLHGAPGVGKTSTAECVAEYTQRPLYALTCGDIGETARDVEENLDRCFQLAHTWGCVLLLDEADVFLAKRDKADLKRNALVSVFLRTLEYYAGILFLTTNRVATFDDAFKSRIHMSLYYPALDGSSTKQVWEMNVQRTREITQTVELDEDEIVKFGVSHYKKAKKVGSGKWNGRQIRNAFQTAIALAEWEVKQGRAPKPKLTRTHFEKVAEASRAFDKYLNEVHQLDEEARASVDKIRADWITPVKSKTRSPKHEDSVSKSTKSSKKSARGEDTKRKRKKSKKQSDSDNSEEVGTSAASSSSEASSN